MQTKKGPPRGCTRAGLANRAYPAHRKAKPQDRAFHPGSQAHRQRRIWGGCCEAHRSSQCKGIRTVPEKPRVRCQWMLALAGCSPVKWLRLHQPQPYRSMASVSGAQGSLRAFRRPCWRATNRPSLPGSSLRKSAPSPSRYCPGERFGSRITVVTCGSVAEESLHARS